MKQTICILLWMAGLVALSTGCQKGPDYKIYTYPAQTATALSPASGYPGIDVTINGKNFGTLAGAVKVFFGGVQADTVRSCTDGQIVVKVPPKAISGKVTLKVWTTSIDSIGSFTVIAAPIIKSASASAGSPGDVITLKGTGFGTVVSNLAIKFNGTSGVVNTVVADTLITATVPAGFTSGNIVLYVNGFPVTGPGFAYLVPVPNAVYQLDFENNLNEANGGTPATYTQGAASPISYMTGVSGQAVSLAGYANAAGGTNNGVYNQILALPVNAARYNELTVSCWVNWPVQSDWSPIFDFGQTRGNRLVFLARATAGWNGAGNNMVGRIIFENVTGFTGYQETNAVSSSAIPATGWHHVAMTVSKTTLLMKMYLDGALIKTQALPAAYDLTAFNQNHAYIGANSYGTANEPSFAGGIDKFQIFNSVLTDNQVYTVYFKK
ncbi:LamG-like jellyroll fold domain-containing protein [Chitinophagaceae bacterium LWZ2-11]